MLKNKMENQKMLIATSIGSMLEIFDFLSFVFLSSIIAKLFFPANTHGTNILFTYITIAISYLLRPIGGIILGNLGDKFGRKSVFTLSILLMSIPSFAISILPIYHTIGYWATCLLIIFRIMQGFSLGGEVPGSITYLQEKFHNKNYFLATAWLTFGANLGVVAAAKIVEFLTHTLSTTTMLNIGFRIPFFLGGFLSIIGFYIRSSITESPEFQALQQTKTLNQAPIKHLILNFKQEIVAGILMALLVSVITSVFHIILPNLLVSYFSYSLHDVIDLSIIGALSLAIFSIIFAYLTQYFRVIYILRMGIISLVFIFLTLILKPALIFTHLNLVVFLISVALAAINGLFFGILADLFPTQVRFSGVALCYNTAYILGAGLTPLWCDLIIKSTHSLQAVLLVCLIMSIISLLNIHLIKKLIQKNSVRLR